MTSLSGLAITVWWGGLVVTLVIFVPLAVMLLHRTLTAARNIERYTRETLVAAGGIAGNTEHITALDATASVASDMLATAGQIAGKLDTVATVLEERAS
jgi:hypothetical protein